MSINSVKYDNLSTEVQIKPVVPNVGSKHTWTSRDSKRIIVSVQLAHGSVIQVKDITLHVRHYSKKYYRTLDEWRSSLPKDGKIHTEHNENDDPAWFNWEVEEEDDEINMEITRKT